jgi:putative transcriptional regulator
VTIVHHLDDATIVALAAGTLNEAHAVIAAAHISMCPECRSTLKKAEAIGGGILADHPEQAITSNLKSATLAKLQGALVLETPSPRSSRAQSELPDVLVRTLGVSSLDDVKWKRKLPGIAMYDVPMQNGTKTKLKLLSLDKGMTMPVHGHGGEELTLVLRGSYRDKMGRFAAGDVADLAEDVEHQPIVDSDETCICLISFDVPAKFKSVWARLAQPFAGM